MVYAQISNGIVKNTIVLDDLSLLPLFSQGFERCIRVDNLDVVPSIGWSYDGEEFIAPPPPIINEEEDENNGN